MSVALQEDADGKVLIVILSGTLSTEDYDRLVPEVERLIKQHGKIRMLVQMHDFHGWTVGALWQDIKFDAKHFRHIKRLAMIGETAWEHGMALFCKPFTTAKIRYFPESKSEEAREWIHEGIEQPA